MSVGVGVLLVAALVLWSLGAWPFGGASRPPPRSAHQRDARTAHGANAGGDPTRGASGPRAAEAGALEVLSDPPGAIVSVDGLPTGRRTPARLGVRPGRHQVLVRWDDGGEAQEERLVHAREKLTVHLARSVSPPGNRRPSGPPAPWARRRVRGTAADPGSPGEAARAVDGARRAPPPEVAPPAPEGTSAPAGRRDVRSRPGAVQFLCRPWALVSVSGQELGQTPVGRVLVPGTHRVTFRNDSLGQREEVAITVRAGDRPRRVECHFGAGK